MCDHPSRPVLYWDGDCGFCRKWVARWKQTTGDHVLYRTLQEAPQEVVAAAGGQSLDRIVLQKPDGSLVSGARAAVTALATRSRASRLVLSGLQRIPLLSRAAEATYAWIAAHREFCGKLTHWIWGNNTLVPTYEISGWLFPRAAGCIFLAAFISLWSQVDGLAGSRGILPVAAHLDAVRSHFSSAGSPHEAWWQIPSLLWFGASDGMLHFLLGVGSAASLMMILGFVAAPAALVAWVCYLSFVSAVPLFLNFQWDSLLLETGTLVAIFAPWRWRLRLGQCAPLRVGRLLVWWLLFRLMFESGVVKLYGFDASGSNAWLEGTALKFHYFTQPIPTWTAWWATLAPDWFHKLCLASVFAIELLLPFFIVGPRRLRMVAFWGFMLLMAVIMGTGNYGFFNLLTAALCITLVDDACWPSWLGIRARTEAATATASRSCVGHFVRRLIAAVLVTVTCVQFMAVLRIPSPALLQPALDAVLPFRSTNSYGLFSVMTTERPEISIETSLDGEHWMPLQFRHKMSADRTAMPFFMPHMPRLDWLMWFAALEFRATGSPPAWFGPLFERFRENSPDVWRLLDESHPPDKGPDYFRIRLDLLTFTTPHQKRTSGRFWNAEPLSAYTIEGRLTH